MSKIQKLKLKGVSEPLGNPFLELESVESTNKYAMGLIHEGLASHGLTILSHEQTAGRGQRGKSWKSEPHTNLTFSIIVDPSPLLTSQMFYLTACTAVSVLEVITKYLIADIFIKWPNDIYWRDRKAGGILIENSITTSEKGDNWKWAVIGIGVNINQTNFPGDLPNPVSLKQITGVQHSVIEIAKDICARLTTNMNFISSKNEKKLIEIYNENLFKKDQTVKLRKGTYTFDATIKRVTNTGELVIQHAIEEPIRFGDVEFVM